MMNQEDIFKKIGQILTELNEQYQYLAQNPRELNELELELFLANSRFLSDHVQIIKKINSGAAQKSLPEHAGSTDTESVIEPVVKHTEVFEEPVVAPAGVTEAPYLKPLMEDDIFKLDNEPASFEFILSDKPSSDRFDFEEKSVDEIFDRPLSKEEEQIIAQKQKLREMDSLGILPPEEDEIGPEPFLVAESVPEEPAAETPVFAASPEDEPAAETHLFATESEDEPAVEDPEEEKEEPVQDPLTEEAPVEEDLIAEEPFKEEPVVVHSPVLPTFTETVSPGFAAPVVPAVTESAVTEPVLPPAPEPAKSQLQEELFRPIRSEILPKPTLNDILSGNTQAKNVNAQSSRAPITDLKQAINLNDKMRYIKDLFNGYNLAYAEAIDLLNKMPDFKTADSFLQHNYAVKNNWAARQETADQFYELLNQRFPAAK